MAVWRKSNAGLWLGGILFTGFWTEDSTSATRMMCYRDPAGPEGGAKWAMTDLSKFGRTVSADGAAMARQATEFCGMPWYAGGGRILFHLLGKWYLVPSSTWAWPKGLPYTALNEDGTYADDAMSWCESAAFDVWARPGTQTAFAAAGAGGASAATVTVSAPDALWQTDQSTREFGKYEGGHWLGIPTWRWRGGGTERHIYLVAGVWVGAAESGGALEFAHDGGLWRAASWALESPIAFAWAGDGEARDPVTFEWRNYGSGASSPGRDLTLQGPRLERAVAEAAAWR